MRKLKFSWVNLLMFLIGACSTFDFALVGRVTLAEVLAFASIPYFWLIKREGGMNGNFVKCLWILALMFFGVIISDIVNQNYIWYSARAVARPAFMLGYLLFFIPLLKRDSLSIIAMVYGQIIAGIIKYIRPSQFEDAGSMMLENYSAVVFRIQPMVSAIIIGIAVWIYPRSRLLAVMLYIGGAVSVVMLGGARSSVLIWILAAGILCFIAISKSRFSRKIVLSKSRLFFLAVVTLISLSAVYSVYVYAAPRGYLGEEQQAKMLAQSRNVFGASPIGLLLSGRTQVYAAVLGVMDKPIFGFGSWRHDLTSKYVVEAMAAVGTDAAVMDRINSMGSVSGAGHSVLMQAWVENGVLPAIAFISAMWITLKVGVFSIKYENRMTPYFTFTIISFIWAFLFSPLGLGMRLSLGLFMAFYVVFMDKKKSMARVHVMS